MSFHINHFLHLMFKQNSICLIAGRGGGRQNGNSSNIIIMLFSVMHQWSLGINHLLLSLASELGTIFYQVEVEAMNLKWVSLQVL